MKFGFVFGLASGKGGPRLEEDGTILYNAANMATEFVA